MRIALVSDLHGNALALKQVLARIKAEGVDQLICLGDVATLGPEPEAVLEQLHENQAICILGNHDEFMLRPELVASYTTIPVLIDAIDWCRSRLSKGSLEFIQTFRDTYEQPLNAEETFFAFHGTPSSNTIDLLATTDAAIVEQWIAGVPGTVLAGGHTHIQMLRQHRGRTLVNPGSVGMPFKEYVSGAAPEVLPHAEYAIISSTTTSVNVSLERVALDKSKLRKAVLDVDFPLATFLAQAYAG